MLSGRGGGEGGLIPAISAGMGENGSLRDWTDSSAG